MAARTKEMITDPKQIQTRITVGRSRTGELGVFRATSTSAKRLTSRESEGVFVFQRLAGTLNQSDDERIR